MERVSKAQAVKLKELGYDVKSDGICDHDGNTGTSEARNWNLTPAGFPKYYEKWMSMPYLDEVIDWLRNKHDTMVTVYANASGYLFDHHDTPNKGGSHRYDSGYTGPNDSGCWDKYEDAKSDGIDKALDILSQQNAKNGNND